MQGSLPFDRVQLRDPFWTSWQKKLMQKGMMHQYRQCEETGRLENFRRVARGDQSGHQGLYFNDSDVYKWLEAASYALAVDPNWEGRRVVDECIELVAQSQAPDGYISTSFQIGQIEKRWKALTAKHEMYCIGHLVEAGVAHNNATGEQTLLSVARKAADHVRQTFGPALQKGYCGHQEFELACCRLSDVTRDEKYRQLAEWMTLARGSRPSPFEAEFDDSVSRELDLGYLPLVFPRGTYDGTYFQDDRPLIEQDTAVGHAVRAMYFYCGAVDSCFNPAVQTALERIWSNLTRKRMYVTGGIGSAGRNEGFTSDFDLPNREAYAETCAAIGLVFWASRMSRATGESKYADIMELALYNAVLSGISEDTDKYFYVNPLESRGDHHREPWFNCACCPPNIARLILSVHYYAAFENSRGLSVDLPIAASYTTGKGTIHVESEWPWSGQVLVRTEEITSPLRVRVRIPNWTDPQLPASVRVDNGYAVLDIVPGQRQEISLNFSMKPRRIYADPNVAEAVGKVAIAKGPLVYCLEECDFDAPVHLFEASREAPLTEASMGAQRSLDLEGLQLVPDAQQLYSSDPATVRREARARLVPYYSWDNRASGSMAVWLREH